MKIKFTNGNGDEADINIKGKCKITDYDTRKKLPDGKDLTVDVDGENLSIMNGTELKQDSQTVEMNANKYSIFTAIAGMDGDNSNLTEKDIAKAKKSFKNKNDSWNTLFNLGVTQIRYDSHAGVATIVIGEKELLRIDFQTWRERMGVLSDSSNITETDVITEPIEKTGEEFFPVKPFESFTDSLAQRESSGIVNKVNKKGYVGLYQIGEEAMADIGIYYKKSKNYKNNDWTGTFKKNEYGITSLSDFKNNAEKQNLVLQALMKKNWSYIKYYGLDKYIGKEIKGQIITESGLLAGSHLGGIGKLKQYLESDGKIDRKDGNGVRVSVYLGEFAHYDMSRITDPPNLAIAIPNKSEKKEEPIVNEPPVEQVKVKHYVPREVKHYVPRVVKPNDGYKVILGPIMPPAGNREYIIEDGDNLIKIAKNFNTTVEAIKKINNLKNDNIVAGKKLIIPPPNKK